jgi:flagella basal body P-ring formation protein FlgA
MITEFSYDKGRSFMPSVKRMIGILLMGLVWLLPAFGQAARQSSQAIYQAVDLFLQEYAKTLPGEVNYEIGNIDPRMSMSICGQPKAELARNVKPMGQTRVMVSCSDYATWTVHVPVTIRVYGDYPVAARQLRRGDVLSESDIMMQRGDISTLPQQVVLDISSLLGKVLSMGLNSGQPFRHHMVKTPDLVLRGQNVSIVYSTAGFSATNTGQAMSDGGAGDLIPVRTSSGTIIKGIVQPDGTVKVQ